MTLPTSRSLSLIFLTTCFDTCQPAIPEHPVLFKISFLFSLFFIRTTANHPPHTHFVLYAIVHSIARKVVDFCIHQVIWVSRPDHRELGQGLPHCVTDARCTLVDVNHDFSFLQFVSCWSRLIITDHFFPHRVACFYSNKKCEVDREWSYRNKERKECGGGQQTERTAQAFSYRSGAEKPQTQFHYCNVIGS